MEQQIIVRDRQQFQPADMMDMQAGLRETFDELVRQAVGDGSYYSGFGASGQQFELTLQPGRLYINGAMYRRNTSTVFAQDLFNLRPLAQKKMIAVIGAGTEIETTPDGTAAEPRQFLIDTTTMTWEIQPVSTRKVRYANIQLVAGIEHAQPTVPAIGAGSVLIAVIQLGNTGIESVTMNPDGLLPQVERNAIQIQLLAEMFDVLGLRVATLISDQAAMKREQERFATKDELSTVRALAQEAFDTAKRALSLAENLDIGATFLRDFQDRFEDLRLSDTAASGFSSRVENGLFFPLGSSTSLVNGIETFNAVEPKVSILNDLMLPAFTHRLGVDTFGQGKVARQAALQAFSSGTQVVKTTRPPVKTVRYESRASSFVASQKAAGNTDSFMGVFVSSGGAYAQTATIPLTAAALAWAKSHSTISNAKDFKVTGMSVKMIGSTGGTTSLLQITVKYTYTKEISETGKEYVTETETTIDGQGRAETWLQERDGWLTRVGIFLTQKGPTGDIKLMITEVDASGAPNAQQAPVVITVPFANLIAAPMSTVSPDGIETIVTIPPVMCFGGRRYAMALISSGAHFVRMTEGVKASTQGEHWALTDANKWERPALETVQTMAMRLYFARFASTRVEVDLKPLSLVGGIQDVFVQTQGVTPALTEVSFEVQPTGADWQVLGATSGQRHEADFTTNPELVPFRAVFEGTLDVMPAISRGATKSNVTASRRSLTLNHSSQVIDVGAGVTANQVKIIHRLRDFDETPDNFTVTLVTDPLGTPTTETADAVTDEILSDGTISRTSVFSFVTGKRYFRIKALGTAAALANLFSVDEVYAAFYDI